ncbi:MAG: RND family transporter [Halobacterium sp.]
MRSCASAHPPRSTLKTVRVSGRPVQPRRRRRPPRRHRPDGRERRRRRRGAVHLVVRQRLRGGAEARLRPRQLRHGRPECHVDAGRRARRRRALEGVASGDAALPARAPRRRERGPDAARPPAVGRHRQPRRHGRRPRRPRRRGTAAAADAGRPDCGTGVDDRRRGGGHRRQRPRPGPRYPGREPLHALSTDYEPGSTSADARVLFVFQQTDGGDSLSDGVVDAQLRTDELAASEIGSEAFVFGAGIVDEEAGSATGESFAVITPVALLLILGVLGVAYRDPVDVALALLGTLVTLVWMAGFMGWAGIGVTQILIAVPFLLVGLSIDYALHVVMRYREARQADGDRSPREGMRVGVAGVTVALAATTFTTAVGLLSNTVSPIQAIGDFGLVSAAGIVSAFVVFAVLLPAAKLEVDGLLERVGWNRRRTAFGTGGAASRVVGVGTTIARRAPVAIVVVALVVSAGGGYAATDIDTSIDQVDFLPRDSPEWMDSLPAPFAPSDYSIRENAVFLNDNFAQSRDRTTVHVLVEGPVTSPDTLQRVAEGTPEAADASSVVTLANGRPDVDSPVTAIRTTAAENESFAALVAERDGDGDGVPDSDLATVYDALYRTAPDRADDVVYRADGEYRAVDARITVSASSSTATIASELRGVAATVGDGSDLTVTATGPPIVDEVVQSALLRTLVETFLLTLGVILAFLTALFYRRYDAPLLGAVTMVPVVAALGWILGAMCLLGIPFTTETAVIASIAIGLGVDYAIHVSERFVHELGPENGVFDALNATVQGTGGALLASAASTAAGFGVLVFALVPSLRRFGAVTSATIAFAFVASVLVLPSLVSLWYRYAGAPAAPDA